MKMREKRRKGGRKRDRAREEKRKKGKDSHFS